MTDHLGLGVMIGMLSGNEDTVKALANAVGKPIATIRLADDVLQLAFVDGTGLHIWDDGQSCCEHRYMSTDDDLSAHVGGLLQDVEIREAPNVPDEYGEHEVQFLVVRTSRGRFTMETHNEHNGYYGGFWLQAKLMPATEPEPTEDI